jgi:hypothetical protein
MAEERPTVPAPPPPEHLQRLRLPGPVRARLAARRRPSLGPATRSWVANLPRTATNRWRAIAATVLGGGSGRESRVDATELAAPAALERSTPDNAIPFPGSTAPPEESAAPTPDDPARTHGPGGTVRIRARDTAPDRPLPSKTQKLVARPATSGEEPAPDPAWDTRRAVVRRWIVGVSVVLLGAWVAWFVLRGRNGEPLAPGAGLSASPLAEPGPAPSVEATTAPVPSSVSAVPSAHDLAAPPAASAAPSGKHPLRPRGPRRSSEVF